MENVLAQLERVNRYLDEVNIERSLEVLEEMRLARMGDDDEDEPESLECGCTIGGTMCATMRQIQQRILSTWYLSEWREHEQWLTTRLHHLGLPEEERYNWR